MRNLGRPRYGRPPERVFDDSLRAGQLARSCLQGSPLWPPPPVRYDEDGPVGALVPHACSNRRDYDAWWSQRRSYGNATERPMLFQA
jgi:hypothetical protein